MLVQRTLYSTVRDRFLKRDIVVLTGMRRVGKTTLCRMLFDSIEGTNKVFLDIENAAERQVFEEKDFRNIWANLRDEANIDPAKPTYLFLDEIQSFPEIVRVVKYLHDHYPTIHCIVTGSSSFYLRNLFPESLAGRKTLLTLTPFSFQEFLRFKGVERAVSSTLQEKAAQKTQITAERLRPFLDEYLLFGGFPEVVMEATPKEKKRRLGDILGSYIEKDVRTLGEFRDIDAFRRLLFLLIARAGSKIEVTKMASDIGVTRPTVLSYLAFLEQTFVVHLIPPFTRNADREVSRTKKVYLADPGFVAQFGNVGAGHLFENAVFLNLQQFGSVRYYERRSGGEVDFILPDASAAVEVKERGDTRDCARTAAVARDLKLNHAYLVTKSFDPHPDMILAVDL